MVAHTQLCQHARIMQGLYQSLHTCTSIKQKLSLEGQRPSAYKGACKSAYCPGPGTRARKASCILFYMSHRNLDLLLQATKDTIACHLLYYPDPYLIRSSGIECPRNCWSSLGLVQALKHSSSYTYCIPAPMCSHPLISSWAAAVSSTSGWRQPASWRAFRAAPRAAAAP